MSAQLLDFPSQVEMYLIDNGWQCNPKDREPGWYFFEPSGAYQWYKYAKDAYFFQKNKDREEGNGDRMLDEGAPIYDTSLYDPVKRPSHYNQGNIEVKDFIQDQKLEFCEGNAVKYICRARYKGSEIEDLKKAIQNLEMRVEYLEQTGRPGTTT